MYLAQEAFFRQLSPILILLSLEKTKSAVFSSSRLTIRLYKAIALCRLLTNKLSISRRIANIEHDFKKNVT